jgi:hypothetical protein
MGLARRRPTGPACCTIRIAACSTRAPNTRALHSPGNGMERKHESRGANCWDYAVVKASFATLKVGARARDAAWSPRWGRTPRAVSSYNRAHYCNGERRHSTLVSSQPGGVRAPQCSSELRDELPRNWASPGVARRLTTQMGPYRRSSQAADTFDVDDVGDFAYGSHDVVELGDVGDFESRSC